MRYSRFNKISMKPYLLLLDMNTLKYTKNIKTTILTKSQRESQELEVSLHQFLLSEETNLGFLFEVDLK